jgi:hypothetical protein
VLEASLARQIRRHGRALLARQRRTEARVSAVKSILRFIGGLVGAGGVNDLLEVAGTLEELREIAEEVRAGAAQSTEEDLEGPNEEAVTAFASQDHQ